ncbi:MAG: hypothetical protein JNJ59_12980 [Deltaproteobacteria bacterium]|nr:hypothetical protein [Deltaproteobacteria bacterium]
MSRQHEDAEAAEIAEVPEILVERLRLGELPPEVAARVRARLEARGELGRVQALAADDAAILARHPSLPRHVLARVAGAPGRRAGAVRWVPLLAVVAATMVLALRVPIEAGVPRSSSSAGDPTERTDLTDRVKGDPALFVWRERAGASPVRVRDGDRAEAGDRLRLVFERGDFAAAALYSIDGRGTVTEHLAPGVAAPRVTLPSSFVLDDAPDFERFLLVLAREPFGDPELRALGSALEALAASPDRATAPLAIQGMTVLSLRLDKRASP